MLAITRQYNKLIIYSSKIQCWCRIPFSDHTCTQPRLYSKVMLLLHWLHTACRHFVEQELEATNTQPSPIWSFYINSMHRNQKSNLYSLPHTMTKDYEWGKTTHRRSYLVQRNEPPLRRRRRLPTGTRAVALKNIEQQTVISYKYDMKTWKTKKGHLHKKK